MSHRRNLMSRRDLVVSTRNLIKVHSKFPKELFRVNLGRSVNLRVFARGRSYFDVFHRYGMVMPKALDPSTYRAPNGASMRPNSRYQQSLVAWRFKGVGAIVYAVPKGTTLPDDLLLVHERPDHYSLQPAVEMTIDDLNTKITRFFTTNARVFTREEWLKAYPKATDNF